jgi:hypothetical protein
VKTSSVWPFNSSVALVVTATLGTECTVTLPIDPPAYGPLDGGGIVTDHSTDSGSAPVGPFNLSSDDGSVGTMSCGPQMCNGCCDSSASPGPEASTEPARSASAASAPDAGLAGVSGGNSDRDAGRGPPGNRGAGAGTPTDASASSCDFISCPSGCCTGARCMPGTDNTACGTFALACSDCTRLNQTCNATFRQCGL